MGLAIPQGVPALKNLTVNPNVLSSGNSGTASVTLTAVAVSDTAVSLASSDPSVSIPASVIVHAGSITASFSVSTTTVLADTSVMLTASLNSISKQVSLLVTQSKILSLKLTPTSVVGGEISTGKVTLSAASPAEGFVVNISSSNTSAVAVSASVTVPAGSKTATFPITSLAVSVQKKPIISATTGVTKSTTLTVNP